MDQQKLEMLRDIFPEEAERIDQGLCPICGQAVDHESFKAEINQREFEISGMCQICQDKIFTEDGSLEIPFADLDDPEAEALKLDQEQYQGWGDDQ